MKKWKISGSIVLVLFVAVSVYLSVRKVDGAGVAQTPKLRNITLIIWGIFGLIIFIGYLIWLAVLKHRADRK
ncbi:DUF3923 family protein [Lactobacillus helveticus]|uniref:DUF3923 family protein n=1 Tax=Lactobacillus helveticus TaxID=1587 RepID=UPI00046D55B3|nr:DUF3923 family protein [Lactobacillus helveticus]NRO07362.1 hypothetical protein [Lactobacillus helveticus]NRO19963.1 hypothetical protein [Lactobacillus helveticus]NRO31913.1 hypothetical protein [Lactobacillus helveticus]NRO39878.1 hypothetical protein [Lactobacillus helveticus]NRO47553.1 hypothetical protein [Lactobacillus helveticus]